MEGVTWRNVDEANYNNVAINWTEIRDKIETRVKSLVNNRTKLI